MAPVGLCLALCLLILQGPSASALEAADGRYRWPVRGPVLRPFEGPSDPFASGHRGIDIGVPFGSAVGASQDGVVTFAGWVAGSLFVTIAHRDGLRTSYSWLSEVAVQVDDPVGAGEVIGRTGHGHQDVAEPHLHFSVRAGSTYIDPMLVLESATFVGIVHLAPLDAEEDSEPRPRRPSKYGNTSAGPRSMRPPPRMAGPVYRGCPRCDPIDHRDVPVPFVELRFRGPP